MVTGVLKLACDTRELMVILLLCPNFYHAIAPTERVEMNVRYVI